MMELVFEIKSREVESILLRLQQRLINPAPLMAAIAAELLSITERSFEKEADSDGNAWKKLALSTIRHREKKGQWPGKILQVSTAGLAASILPFSDSKTAGISSSKPYAAIHQLSGQAGRGKKVYIPSRPFMPVVKNGDALELTDNAQRSVTQMMFDYFNQDGDSL